MCVTAMDQNRLELHAAQGMWLISCCARLLPIIISRQTKEINY